MGTTTKGRGVWFNPWQMKRYSDHGAFGQSHYQRIKSHNERVNVMKALQAILTIDKGISKEERQRHEKQLKELRRQCSL